ncbi:MAG: glutamate synthase large subunit [Candidatus Bipolaricaulia bacterium]
MIDYKHTLYDPRFEHDGCGIGFVADLSGRPSHEILEQAICAVVNVTHRGAIDADAGTGDGAGLLTQIPKKLFLKQVEQLGHPAPDEADLAVGTFFLPQDEEIREQCRWIIETVLSDYGVTLFGWREVPVDPSVLGEKASVTQPRIEQLLVGRPQRISAEAYERTLYLTRKRIEARVRREIRFRDYDRFYIPSFSSRTIVYKGLFVAPQLGRFYLDLNNPEYQTALAVFHQRYSTNTFPSWERAQPFRMLCHNGEINTLQGNVNWMGAREAELASSIWGDAVQELRPIIDPSGSDSAMLDNVLELLVLSGRDIRHALMMLIPEAWQYIAEMDPAWKAFYQYHSCLMEPWDGPAAVTFTDGRVVGTTLDRNGLRPVRYAVTQDGFVISASEVGVVELNPSRVIRKEKLGPGQMIAVDTAAGVFLENGQIKETCATSRSYKQWIERNMIHLERSKSPRVTKIDVAELVRQQTTFGYTAEDLTVILRPMTATGAEPVGSMGDDTPQAVLADKPRPLYNYFKQRFAQVTNPPIDHLREELVMSLQVYLGARKSILEETPTHARLLQLDSPILMDDELEAIRKLDDPGFSSITLDARFPVAEGPDGLERAITRLCEQASQAIDEGKTIVILSDRGIDETTAPIPMLLAIGTVHHYLIRYRKRMHASLVAETGEAREVHHFATLIGYGANAINPYLALATACYLVENGRVKGMEPEAAMISYRKAVEKGLLKVMSKMGISPIASYHGAQIFEAIGLSEDLVERCFTGTPSRIGGIGLNTLANDVLSWHWNAFPKTREREDGLSLPSVGFYKFKKGGEHHAVSPQVVTMLHQAVRDGDPHNGGYPKYQKYAELVNRRHPIALRDLLDFVPGKPIPIAEVEPIEAIFPRFSTAGMSLGSLSAQVHENLAIAMNRIGAMSNTGEGGEAANRYHPRANGDNPNSRIKQVASGRFGVTTAYLASADELQIKMAQGSKPGEGGQIPGHKVSAEIAAIRHTVPGIALISPPPHHDIYSIEDLAQLIYDLKQSNPRAKVSVKLVSEAGVGIIAAGVAKGYADVVLISGHSGGTGSSPLNSIKNAGAPWELGLAETQQTLVLNNLRGRIRVRTDGGLQTGRDVVIAAMLGADEYSFGTSALVASGCLMARACHANTCPVGIATQDEKLRAKFPGTPEMVVHFFTFLANEVREILAELGFRSLDEVIGRTDLLQQVPTGNPKIDSLDLSKLLVRIDDGTRPRRNVQSRNNRPKKESLDERLIRDANRALDGDGVVTLAYPIDNTQRTVGATLAWTIAKRYGDVGLPAGTIEVTFTGSAGQSFGAFCINGLRFILIGEANDYVGKGMAGGELVVKPPEETAYVPHRSAIMGNTVMYGATGGSLLAAGRAGERFCIRNSGGRAVIEGVGDHGCEYMTGGVAVVLGEVGYNFGAGMTGGIVYVLDEHETFPQRYNPELIRIDRIETQDDAEELHALITHHWQATGSALAREILEDWADYLPLFWRVAPKASVAEIESTNEGALQSAVAGARTR